MENINVISEELVAKQETGSQTSSTMDPSTEHMNMEESSRFLNNSTKSGDEGKKKFTVTVQKGGFGDESCNPSLPSVGRDGKHKISTIIDSFPRYRGGDDILEELSTSDGDVDPLIEREGGVLIHQHHPSRPSFPRLKREGEETPLMDVSLASSSERCAEGEDGNHNTYRHTAPLNGEDRTEENISDHMARHTQRTMSSDSRNMDDSSSVSSNENTSGKSKSSDYTSKRKLKSPILELLSNNRHTTSQVSEDHVPGNINIPTSSQAQDAHDYISHKDQQVKSSGVLSHIKDLKGKFR